MPDRQELHEHDADQWAVGERRLRILSELAENERAGAKAVVAAARDLGIHRSQCYELLRRYRRTPTVSALMPRTRGRSKGRRILEPAVDILIEKTIDEFYLDLSCPTVADLMREIERRCAAAGLTPPSRRAVTPRLRDRNQRDVLRRRKGAAHARNKLGLIVGGLNEDEPLALVQIDHTLADVIVVSGADRGPLGRPWLTLAIDVATRVVAGFYLSLEAPSALSVAMVLSQAVLPKDPGFASRKLSLSWPVAGLPKCLHLDNAREFHSQALARGVAEYGIDLQYRPPATPHWGGHIERLVGTMMGALRLLPGYTGRSVAERGHAPEETAIMTMDELEIWLMHQIAGVYHQAVHRSLGMAPITAWTEAVARMTAPHRHPPDGNRFYLDFLPFRQRLIQRSGISLFGITYTDGIISTFLAKARQKFVVRYDPRDMSRVYLRDTDGAYWTIPYADRRLPPVTLSEVKTASRRLRASGEKHVTQARLFASMDEQRELVEQARTKTKIARRTHERTVRALHGALHGALPGVSGVPQAEVGDTQSVDIGPILPFPVEEWS